MSLRYGKRTTLSRLRNLTSLKTSGTTARLYQARVKGLKTSVQLRYIRPARVTGCKRQVRPLYQALGTSLVKSFIVTCALLTKARLTLARQTVHAMTRNSACQ